MDTTTDWGCMVAHYMLQVQSVVDEGTQEAAGVPGGHGVRGECVFV